MQAVIAANVARGLKHKKQSAANIAHAQSLQVPLEEPKRASLVPGDENDPRASHADGISLETVALEHLVDEVAADPAHHGHVNDDGGDGTAPIKPNGDSDSEVEDFSSHDEKNALVGFNVNASRNRLLVYSVLDGSSPYVEQPDWVKRLMNIYTVVMCVAIVVSIITFLYESLAANWERSIDATKTLELIVVIFFTTDYLTRLVLTPMPRFAYSHGFIWNVNNQIDFWSVLPFYIELMIGSGGAAVLTVLRVLRLFRLARVMKMSKYSTLLNLVGATLARSLSAFGLLLFMVSIAALVCGTLQFYAENLTSCDFDEKTRKWHYSTSGDESPYQSILDAVWWAMVTLTTVGYGDKFPISWLGQVQAALTVMIGMVVLAFPITIIGSNFSELLLESQQNRMDKEEAALTVRLEDEHDTSSQLVLMRAIREEVRAQAGAINAIQDSLNEVGKRWRIIEAASHRVNSRMAVAEFKRRQALTEEERKAEDAAKHQRDMELKEQIIEYNETMLKKENNLEEHAQQRRSSARRWSVSAHTHMYAPPSIAEEGDGESDSLLPAKVKEAASKERPVINVVENAPTLAKTRGKQDSIINTGVNSSVLKK